MAKSNRINNRAGFSLVEVILAIGLFGLFATALIGLRWASYGSDVQAAQKDKATLYAQQGIEAAWSIRRQAWNLLVNGSYGLTTTSGHWEFNGSDDSLDNGLYTRVVTIADGCRDGAGILVDCSTVGASVDLHLKKVTSAVSYTTITRIASTVTQTTYLTTWQTKDWTQTDWSGGPGQNIWSNINRYQADDNNLDYSTSGEIKLASTGGGCGTRRWPFTTPTDYTYNPVKIDVTAGQAQLKSQAGSPASGSTTNPGFDSGSSGWTYADWDQGPGEVNITGSYISSAGNPGGRVVINAPAGASDELGGYWYQAFTTTVSNPTVTVNLDWQADRYDPEPITFKVYAFVDSTAGSPTISQAVWSSGEITATNGWTTQANINASSRVTTAGTYYLKIAVWIETPGGSVGPLRVGFDNASLNWSGTGSSSYPTDRPTIDPVAAYQASGLEAWSSFTETATKNGGEIYYQLSDNNGSTWQYWDGAGWSNAGSGNYNPATVVNTNISSFATTTGQITFKAFLESNGSQLVSLDNVRVGWGESAGSGSGYATNGYFVSSAFSMSRPAAVDIINWTETIPSCSPVCTIKLQVRTAPDAGGSPGSWTGWYGAGGSDTYFTAAAGAIISPDLNFNQWVQYRAELAGDGSDTPVLSDVTINYLP